MSQHSVDTASHSISPLATTHRRALRHELTASQPPKCHTSIDTGEKTFPKATANEKRERVPD
jgi:hypothetical protein